MMVKGIRLSVNLWWEDFWINYFNCLWKIDLKDVCDDDVKVDQEVFFKIYNVFIFYLIDVVYVLVYVIDLIYKCKELSGLLEKGICLSI